MPEDAGAAASDSASSEGTAAYASSIRAVPGHFRAWRTLILSSLGLGTYLGEVGEAWNRAYEDAIVAALEGGVNVLDTAINYRDQQSERDVGRALRRFGRRRGVVVATKGGFLHGDARESDGRAWFQKTYVETGLLRPLDIAGGAHAMTPTYLRHELERSLENLQLRSVDVYFVHNPESQLQAGVPRAAFEERLRESFVELELQCDAGRIAYYGTATWNGLRSPVGTQSHLGLERLLGIAHEARYEVGGKGEAHHFAAVELPVNLAMPEAGTQRNQPWMGRVTTLLDAAREADLAVFASASLMQGKLLGRVDQKIREALAAKTDLEAAIDFARALPGVTTALVGMGSPEHARENVALATSRPPDPEAAAALLAS
ncbi:MAG: aldo/keto reductase [Euryarchaeota archaeon]|nr:aldo/keto reductase [Euryarchaeota archaeon]